MILTGHQGYCVKGLKIKNINLLEIIGGKNEKIIIVLSMCLFTMFKTAPANALEDITFVDETFEKLVRDASIIKEDEPITQKVLDEVTRIDTVISERINGEYKLKYLTDFTDFKLLKNLDSITYSPNIDNPMIPKNIEVLKTLPLRYVSLDASGMSDKHFDEFNNYIEEKLSGVKQAYRNFLDNISEGSASTAYLDYSLNMRDYSWLDGFDMNKSIKLITAGRRESSKEDKINYIYSHKEGEEKVYKFHLDVPLLSVYSDENNILRTDKNYEHQSLEYYENSSIFDTKDIHPYDINGEIVEGSEFDPNRFLKKVAYIEFYLPESKIDEYLYLLDVGVDSLSQSIYADQWINYIIGEDVSTKHTVNFETFGGSKIDPIENVIKNMGIEKPINPTKENNTFLNWYKDETFTEQWDFDADIVKEDMTLYAKWEEDMHIVNFDSNGGTPVASLEDVTHNSLITKPENPVKEGFIFVGWNLEDKVWDFENDTVIEDITLVAEWTANTYIVNFDSNGGTPVASLEDVTHNSLITKPENPIKEGYTFVGWNLEDKAWDFDNDTVTKDLTLIAKWNKIIIIPEEKDPEEHEVEIITPKENELEPKNPVENNETVKTGLSDKSLIQTMILIGSALYMLILLKEKTKVNR